MKSDRVNYRCSFETAKRWKTTIRQAKGEKERGGGEWKKKEVQRRTNR